MLYAWPSSIIFLIIGSLIILTAFKNIRSKKKSLFIDELILGGFHILMALILPFLYYRYSSISASLFLVTNAFTILCSVILVTIILIEKIRVSKHPNLIKERSYKEYKKNFLASFDEKNKYKRRITHILPAVVILPIYLIAKSMAPWLPNWEALCMCFIITIGSGFVLFFSVGDLVRVNKPSLLPDWANKLFSKGLNKEEVENNTFTTTSAMVLGFGPWLLAGFLVFTVVSLVASVSDAMAAITGFRFGRHNFPKKSKKTVEGYLGGIITTFLLVLGVLLVLTTINPLFIIFLGLVLAGAFFLVDLINLPIDDNKINPHTIGLVLLLIAAF
jgi:dolichol kinase